MHYVKNFTQPCLYCTNIPEPLFSLSIHTVGSHYQPKSLQCTPAYSVSAPLSTSLPGFPGWGSSIHAAETKQHRSALTWQDLPPDCWKSWQFGVGNGYSPLCTLIISYARGTPGSLHTCKGEIHWIRIPLITLFYSLKGLSPNKVTWWTPYSMWILKGHISIHSRASLCIVDLSLSFLKVLYSSLISLLLYWDALSSVRPSPLTKKLQLSPTLISHTLFSLLSYGMLLTPQRKKPENGESQ